MILVALVIDVFQCLGVRASHVLIFVKSCSLGPELLSIVSSRCEDCVGENLNAWPCFIVDGRHIVIRTNVVLSQGFLVLELWIFVQLPTIKFIRLLDLLIIESADGEDVCAYLAIAIVGGLASRGLSS